MRESAIFFFVFGTWVSVCVCNTADQQATWKWFTEWLEATRDMSRIQVGTSQFLFLKNLRIFYTIHMDETVYREALINHEAVLGLTPSNETLNFNGNRGHLNSRGQLPLHVPLDTPLNVEHLLCICRVLATYNRSRHNGLLEIFVTLVLYLSRRTFA